MQTDTKHIWISNIVETCVKEAKRNEHVHIKVDKSENIYLWKQLSSVHNAMKHKNSFLFSSSSSIGLQTTKLYIANSLLIAHFNKAEHTMEVFWYVSAVRHLIS